MKSRYTFLWLALGLAAGCAASNDELGGHGPDTSSGTGGSTTSSSSGASSSSSSSASSTASSTSGGDGGGGGGGQGGATGGGGEAGAPPTGTVLLLGTNDSTVLAGTYHPNQASWTTTTLADASTSGAAIAINNFGLGVGVLQSTSNGGELRYVTWDAGVWTPPAPISPAPAPLVTTRARPSIVADMNVRVTFHGDDFKHYYAELDGASNVWLPTAEPIGAGALQSFGPEPASIAVLAQNPIVAFAGQDGDLYDQTRSAPLWMAASPHGLSSVDEITPAIATLTQGADLMIAFVRQTDAKLLWTTRSAGVWTVPLEIESAFTNDPPALIAQPAGAALVAFRGLDGKAYTSRYAPGNVPSWSVPAGIANPNFVTSSSPALAPGVGGVDAEIVVIDSGTGAAYHARLTNQTWTSPVQIGGSALTHVAIASTP